MHEERYQLHFDEWMTFVSPVVVSTALPAKPPSPIWISQLFCEGWDFEGSRCGIETMVQAKVTANNCLL
jgi:hypothetical protein